MSTRITSLLLLLLLLVASCCQAFTSPLKVSSSCNSRFMGQTMTFTPMKQKPAPKRSSTSSSLQMFLGTDGGILGVGTPEVFTILLVGYFVLGPSDLYKLVKEIGKFIQSVRTLGTEATASFESTMESQLEMDEIRKAQSDLNDAFNFRRTINVDQESETFNTIDEERVGTEVLPPLAEQGSGKKKKRIRRRKKKVVEPIPDPEDTNGGAIPDLDMTAAFETAEEKEARAKFSGKTDDDDDVDIFATPKGETPEEKEARVAALTAKAEEDMLRLKRLERLESGQPEAPETENPAESQAASDRFASQMGGTWNDQILDNEDALSPLATVMEKLALLEEERAAADARLQEEFNARTDVEERYYREKRAVLEEAAASVQASAYNLDTTTTPDK